MTALVVDPPRPQPPTPTSTLHHPQPTFLQQQIRPRPTFEYHLFVSAGSSGGKTSTVNDTSALSDLFNISSHQTTAGTHDGGSCCSVRQAAPQPPCCVTRHNGKRRRSTKGLRSWRGRRWGDSGAALSWTVVPGYESDREEWITDRSNAAQQAR